MTRTDDIRARLLRLTVDTTTLPSVGYEAPHGLERLARADSDVHAPDDIRYLLARIERLQAALQTILPELEYAELQARMTFDPLIRDGHAGGKAEHKRMVKAGIVGTPSRLTGGLRDALAIARAALEDE